MFIVKLSRFDEHTREQVRFVERKAHVGYIRYLLLRRIAADDLNRELLRLGLSTVPAETLVLYFQNVLYPVIVKQRLKSFYERYRKALDVPELTLYTFSRDEDARMSYLELLAEVGVDYFIVNEALEYYGSSDLIPTYPDNQCYITTERVPDWETILNHEKRYVIDGLLIDGKTPRMITDYFADVYGDDMLDEDAVTFYKKAFYNVTRQDLKLTIEKIDEELRQVEMQIRDVRDGTIPMTISERSFVLATLRNKKQNHMEQIKRLSSHYSDASFSHGTLEATNLREMFADIAQRTYKRYVTADYRQEDNAVKTLDTLVSMLEKTSNQVLKIDDILINQSKKTVAEEMLEVIHPSMERIEKEQREDMQRYQRVVQTADATVPKEEGGDIIGFDE